MASGTVRPARAHGRPRYCNRVTRAARQPSALAELSFSLVGPGRVGASLASWLVARGARLRSVAGRGLPSSDPASGAAELAARLGGRAVQIDELSTAGDGLLLIAVPDGALPGVAEGLAARRQAAVALHTAGAVPAAALSALAGSTAIGSLHPLKAFPRPLPEVAEAAGVVFGIDGDPAAQALASRIADAWEAKVVVIPPQRRLLYHFAATFAAGGVVTLLAAACELAGRLGLPAAVAEGYLELARGALGNVEPASPQAAITGPVARGDAAALAAALDQLGREAPELLPTALAIGRETLRQVQRNSSSNSAYQAVKGALER